MLGVAKDGLFPRHRTRRWTGCLHKGRDLCSPPLTQAVRTFRQQDVGFRLGDGLTFRTRGILSGASNGCLFTTPICTLYMDQGGGGPLPPTSSLRTHVFIPGGYGCSTTTSTFENFSRVCFVQLPYVGPCVPFADGRRCQASGSPYAPSSCRCWVRSRWWSCTIPSLQVLLARG